MPRGKKKGLNTKKFDRCVTKVKRKGGAKNPYAICLSRVSDIASRIYMNAC